MANERCVPFNYVDPVSRAVIVTRSANPAYGTSEHEADNKDEEKIALLKVISQQLD
jgi:hypothetical protein